MNERKCDIYGCPRPGHKSIKFVDGYKAAYCDFHYDKIKNPTKDE